MSERKSDMKMLWGERRSVLEVVFIAVENSGAAF